MHLEELLCRYQAQAVTREEQQSIEEHLESCRECRSLAATFRKIDLALQGPMEPPAGWNRTEAKILRSMRWTRHAMWVMGMGAGILFVGGILIIALWAQKYPLYAGLAGASLMADAAIFLAAILFGREQDLRMQDATQPWERMRDEWGRALDQGLRSNRVIGIASGIGIATGILLAIPGGLRAKITLSNGGGLFMTVAAAFTLWSTLRQSRRWRNEREALRSFEHM